LLGFLEILNGLIELGVFISLDAFIKLVARAELIAADSRGESDQNDSHKKQYRGLPLHSCSPYVGGCAGMLRMPTDPSDKRMR
jgi:hypothetical protein